jgi:hypothetical protein
MPLYQYSNKSVERTFCFVHIPKAGGAAINSYLRNAGLTAFFDHSHYKPVEKYLGVIPSHYDYETLERLYRLDLMYSFAVVRNPLHKLISEYKFHVQRFNLPPEIKRLNFKEFLKFAVSKLDENPNFWKGHFRPQHHFVGPKVKRIFHYEDGLNNIVKAVLEDNGLRLSGDVQVPVINKTQSQAVLVDSEVLEFISNVFGEDFERFGYRIEE